MLSTVRAVTQHLRRALLGPPTPSRSASSTPTPSASSSSRPWQAAEARPAVGLGLFLTDGRLDEATAIALQAGLPELRGLWRARWESERPDVLALALRYSVSRGISVWARGELGIASLGVEEWLAPARRLVAHLAADCLQQLEEEVGRGSANGATDAALRRFTGLPDLGVPALTVAHRYHLLAREHGEALLATLTPNDLLISEVLADVRAETLLAEQLGDEYTALVHRGYLEVPSSRHRHRVYRLRRGDRIEVIEHGRCAYELCIEPTEPVPEADELLMKLVWLRANEEYVLATANRFPPSPLLR